MASYHLSECSKSRKLNCAFLSAANAKVGLDAGSRLSRMAVLLSQLKRFPSRLPVVSRLSCSGVATVDFGCGLSGVAKAIFDLIFAACVTSAAFSAGLGPSEASRSGERTALATAAKCQFCLCSSPSGLSWCSIGSFDELAGRCCPGASRGSARTRAACSASRSWQRGDWAVAREDRALWMECSWSCLSCVATAVIHWSPVKCGYPSWLSTIVSKQSCFAYCWTYCRVIASWHNLACFYRNLLRRLISDRACCSPFGAVWKRGFTVASEQVETEAAAWSRRYTHSKSAKMTERPRLRSQ